MLRFRLVIASTVLLSINAAAASADAYYMVRPDPIEAGYFVSRLNFAYTQCANGTWSSSCYVADLDTSKLGLDEDSVGYVRDRIEDDDYGVILRADLGGTFAVTEAWLGGASWGWPEGWAVKVEQTGIRCIQAPCEDKLESRLNTDVTAYIAELDFTPAWTTTEEEELAQASLLPEEGGLIVLGWRTEVTADTGLTAKGRSVTQFYTRVE